MEVQLYVYDLTHGMARTMSKQLLGIQIDAVFHTSIVLGKIEYFFGMGIQTSHPGSTHHGQPMEVIPLGTTHLPQDTILDYLESLKEVYTPESYDLFAHNCNNFTNDFAMFLVGKGIPDHITNLPKQVLDTPFGQMLKPQIDASMRSVTQAPTLLQSPLSQGSGTMPGMVSNGSSFEANGTASNTPTMKSSRYGRVMNIADSGTFDKQMKSASDTAMISFFTSSTCAPCKLVYPTFDSLAEQYPETLFVKVDVNEGPALAARYNVRATPTFVTFSRGLRQDEWSGADPSLLRSNIERLVMQTFPPHPHSLVQVPKLQYGSLKPITYPKVPPMDKLMAKLGTAGKDSNLTALRTFIEKREQDARDAALPDLSTTARKILETVLSLPVEVKFAAVDLLRCAMIDPRVSGFFAEKTEASSALKNIISHVNDLSDCPHNLRLVTVHLSCNLFFSPTTVKELMRREDDSLKALLVQLITTSLLDALHPTARVAAASLAFNLSTANYRVRREEEREGLPETLQVELAASLIESLSNEDNESALKAMLLALGYLVYFSPQNGELMDLCGALDARHVVETCISKGGVLASEVVSLL